MTTSAIAPASACLIRGSFTPLLDAVPTVILTCNGRSVILSELNRSSGGSSCLCQISFVWERIPFATG